MGSVSMQLSLPEIKEETHWLTFSEVESYFYSRQQEVCLSQFSTVSHGLTCSHYIVQLCASLFLFRLLLSWVKIMCFYLIWIDALLQRYITLVTISLFCTFCFCALSLNTNSIGSVAFPINLTLPFCSTCCFSFASAITLNWSPSFFSPAVSTRSAFSSYWLPFILFVRHAATLSSSREAVTFHSHLSTRG